MELLNAVELERAAVRHPQASSSLRAWRTVAEAASWKSLIDLRRSYPATDGVRLGTGGNVTVVTVFNVGGNDFRLLTRISYVRQLIQVEAVLTHAEYSKNSWKKRYT